MQWEKKFELNRDGDVVLAEYAQEKVYRLRFKESDEAAVFVKEFQAAQDEIEKYGKLQTSIGILGNIGKKTIKFTFADKNSLLKVKCEFESAEEMFGFFSRMRDQIIKYSM